MRLIVRSRSIHRFSMSSSRTQYVQLTSLEIRGPRSSWITHTFGSWSTFPRIYVTSLGTRLRPPDPDPRIGVKGPQVPTICTLKGDERPSDSGSIVYSSTWTHNIPRRSRFRGLLHYDQRFQYFLSLCPPLCCSYSLTDSIVRTVLKTTEKMRVMGHSSGLKGPVVFPRPFC